MPYRSVRGKPERSHVGLDGGDIKVTIRQIVEGAMRIDVDQIADWLDGKCAGPLSAATMPRKDMCVVTRWFHFAARNLGEGTYE